MLYNFRHSVPDLFADQFYRHFDDLLKISLKEEGKQEAEIDGEREGKLEIEDEEDSEANKLLFCFDFFLKKSTIVVFHFCLLDLLSLSRMIKNELYMPF